MNDNIEKKLVDGVYTITNIRGSDQLADFYDEVIKLNYERYVGISTQNIKFGYNVDTKKAYRLPEGVEFAINPRYKKVETEEVPAEPVSVEVEPKLEAEQPIAVNPIDIVPVEEVQPEAVEEKVVEVVAEPVIEPIQDNKDIIIAELNKKIDELQNLVAIKEEQVGQITNELATLRGVLTETQGKLELANNNLVQLKAEIENNKQEAESFEYVESVDELMDKIKGLGYQVFISR